jgi:hypothetical protein
MALLLDSGAHEFCYVSLVSDKNPDYARPRCSDLWAAIEQGPVQYVPAYHFDGIFDFYVGAGELPGAYTTRITASADRPVPDLDLALEATWESGAFLELAVSVTNNTNEEYNGRLRVCVAERTSRWNTASGEPFHNAMVGDYAYNQPISVAAGGTEDVNAIWDGRTYGFEDLVQANVAIIAAVYDATTGYADQATTMVFPRRFLRGDANADGGVNLADAIYILQNLFSGGSAIVCPDAGDANDDESMNLADAVYILQFLFAQGAAIPAPHPACGEDTTPHPLGGPDLGECEYPVDVCPEVPG